VTAEARFASSSVSNGITVRTGPKISSRAIRIWLVALSKMVGETKWPPLSSRTRRPPATIRAPSWRPDSM
jgi:hypothetical protein